MNIHPGLGVLAVFNDLLPDNDGVDDFLQSLDIPAQETCSNVPISKSICRFPVPMTLNKSNDRKIIN
jgi:hypothetical protein